MAKSEDKSNSLSVGGAIDELGFGRFQLVLTSLTGLCFLADAMEMMLLSILSASLVCSMSISSVEQASLTTIVFFGMWLSSAQWGKMADNHGRRNVLLISGFLVGLFGLLSAIAPNFSSLLALRFLVGVAIGAIPQVCTLYAEYLPSSTRAKAILLMSLAWAIGATLLAILALIIMPEFGWRWLVAAASVPIMVFVLLGIKLLPESVLYLAIKGDEERVQKQLDNVADWNGTPRLPQHAVNMGTKSNSDTKDNNTETPDRGQLSHLFYDGRLHLTLSVSVLWLISGLSYYGVVLLSTELLRLRGSNLCNNVESQAENQQPQCRELTTQDYWDLVWTTLAEFPGTILALLLIDRLGRRRTMSIMALCLSFSMFLTIVTICEAKRLYTLVALFSGRAAATGLFQIVWVYTPEVFPTRLRAVAMGTCSSMARVGAMLTPFLAQVLLSISPLMALMVYLLLGLLAALVALGLRVESQGKDLAAQDNVDYRTFGKEEKIESK